MIILNTKQKAATGVAILGARLNLMTPWQESQRSKIRVGLKTFITVRHLGYR